MTDVVPGTFDFVATGGCPPPVVPEADAEVIAAEHLGLVLATGR